MESSGSLADRGGRTLDQDLSCSLGSTHVCTLMNSNDTNDILDSLALARCTLISGHPVWLINCQNCGAFLQACDIRWCKRHTKQICSNERECAYQEL